MRWGAVALLAIVAIVTVALAARVPKAATTPAIPSANLTPGGAAPDFTVTTNRGPFTLGTATTPVLLEIFATWCPHCRRETATLQDIAVRYAGSVQIVAVTGSPFAVNGSSPESAEDVAAFVQRFGITYAVAFDPTLDVARHYISTGFPTLTLIGGDHRVVWRAQGEIPEGTIAGQIDHLLAARSTSRGTAQAVPKPASQ